jgi:hypothetical protein
MFEYTKEEEKRFELSEKIILIEKLIYEKKLQIRLLNDWIRKIQKNQNLKK